MFYFIFAINCAATTYCCNKANSACFQMEKDSNMLTITITSTTKGWVGLGIGEQSMVGDILIVWRAKDKIIVSNRYGSGVPNPPKYVANSKLSVTNATQKSDSFTVIIQRPLTATNGFKTAADGNAFYCAYKESIVADMTPATDSLQKHDVAEHFQYAFSEENTTTSENPSGNTSSSSKITFCFLLAWIIIVC